MRFSSSILHIPTIYFLNYFIPWPEPLPFINFPSQLFTLRPFISHMQDTVHLAIIISHSTCSFSPLYRPTPYYLSFNLPHDIYIRTLCFFVFPQELFLSDRAPSLIQFFKLGHSQASFLYFNFYLLFDTFLGSTIGIFFFIIWTVMEVDVKKIYLKFHLDC